MNLSCFGKKINTRIKIDFKNLSSQLDIIVVTIITDILMYTFFFGVSLLIPSQEK